jgi:hypothetical protein
MLEQYQYHMTLRMETMTYADRLAADEQAGRIAHSLAASGHGAARRARALAGWMRRALRALPGSWDGAATVEPRRS